MYINAATALALLSLAVPAFAVTSGNATRSSKRGLVYVTSKHDVQDNKLFTASWTDLTWYYNYGPSPTSNMESTSLSFVPMLWGLPSGGTSDTTFLNTVVSQIKGGANITHVLAFNEPDGTIATGGSGLDTDSAAAIWMANFAPLRSKYGVKVGLPAMTGSPTGFNWLSNFNASCLALNPTVGCEWDFIPIHWYGNFEGLASHLGEVRGYYTTTPIWITEYADAGAALYDAQSFYNTSAEYFDRLDYVERYSYFGSFRSSTSNVGTQVAMLTGDGKLTDIGSWYLGGKSTGNIPSAQGAAADLLCNRGLGLTVAAVAAGLSIFIQTVL